MRIKVHLKNVGLASVGWGFPWPTGADIAVFRRPLRDGGNIRYLICIPATSVKGALRSAASRIAKAYDFRSCEGTNPEDMLETCGANPCDVCKLFGLPGMNAPSKIRVSDFYSENAKTSILTRIRIDDSSHQVAEGALFTEECLLPNVVFSGEVEVPDDLERDLIKLLLLAFAELRIGRIGRGSLMDLRIEEPEEIREKLDDEKWLNLLKDLGRWLWSEIP
ncbi:MAG: RAMP superfamily CRISPR-associated protein [Aigarchaeota archaeon]|nr:RAMP superfamily CRISPR-associated protein [Aigarchaeota archaeon]